MTEARDETAANLDFEAFGVPVAVRVAPDLSEDVREVLPPGAQPLSGRAPLETLTVQTRGGEYEVHRDDLRVVRSPDRILALAVLDTEIRRVVAGNVTTSVFVHAGVVAVRDRVVVIPGESFAGKSTLVHRLMAQGATYFSDEYAVLDEQGLVHPYAKPLYLREGRPDPSREYLTVKRVDAAAEGAQVGSSPLRIGAIVVTRYVPGSAWSPERRTPAQGALALFSHTTTAEADPAKALRCVRMAAGDAIVLEGPRGEADDAAEAIISLLS